MGYYTIFNMDVNGLRSEEEFYQLTSALRDKALIGYAFSEPSDRDFHPDEGLATFWSFDAQKWYDRDDDMLDISRRFPHMTFKLYGTGDDPDDRWYTLYKDGSSEEVQAEIVWPEPKTIQWKD